MRTNIHIVAGSEIIDTVCWVLPLVVVVAFPSWTRWYGGQPVHWQIYAFRNDGERIACVAFSITSHLGRHTPDMLSPFMEDGCCCARSLSWLKIDLTWLQRITMSECSLGVLAGVGVQPNKRRGFPHQHHNAWCQSNILFTRFYFPRSIQFGAKTGRLYSMSLAWKCVWMIWTSYLIRHFILLHLASKLLLLLLLLLLMASIERCSPLSGRFTVVHVFVLFLFVCCLYTCVYTCVGVGVIV